MIWNPCWGKVLLYTTSPHSITVQGSPTPTPRTALWCKATRASIPAAWHRQKPSRGVLPPLPPGALPNQPSADLPCSILLQNLLRIFTAAFSTLYWEQLRPRLLHKRPWRLAIPPEKPAMLASAIAVFVPCEIHCAVLPNKLGGAPHWASMWTGLQTFPHPYLFTACDSATCFSSNCFSFLERKWLAVNFIHQSSCSVYPYSLVHITSKPIRNKSSEPTIRYIGKLKHVDDFY